MAKHSFIRASLRVVTLASLVAAFAPASAHADLLATPSAEYCDPTVSQPFRPWGDDANYILVAGGSFEGSNLWALRGGASVVVGNEPFYVNGANDRRSLVLPAGASAVSPTNCFDFADWHARMFARKTTTQSGYLRVEVIVRSGAGVLSVLDGGRVYATGRWYPSERIGLLASNVTSLVGTKAVAFRLTAVGAGFQVDDFYLDPWKSY